MTLLFVLHNAPPACSHTLSCGLRKLVMRSALRAGGQAGLWRQRRSAASTCLASASSQCSGSRARSAPADVGHGRSAHSEIQSMRNGSVSVNLYVGRCLPLRSYVDRMACVLLPSKMLGAGEGVLKKFEEC